MKRWAIGSIAFFLALGIGTFVAWVAWIDHSPSTLALEQPSVEQPLQHQEDLDNTDSLVNTEGLEVFDDMIGSPDRYSCKLLETGSNFHADQITEKNGEKWLGLFIEKGRALLRPTRIKVKRVPDEFVHGPHTENKGKMAGKSVSVAGPSQPLFLVKNSRRVRPGPITTLFVGEREDWAGGTTKPTFLDKDFHQTYRIGGNVYELKVVKARNKRDEPILALLLEGEGKRQLIHTFWTRSEGEYGVKNWLGSVGTLYWVGDLDGDNKPDLYLSLHAHEIIYEAFLLLSSEADKDYLVKKAALFSTSGCC